MYLDPKESREVLKFYLENVKGKSLDENELNVPESKVSYGPFLVAYNYEALTYIVTQEEELIDVFTDTFKKVLEALSFDKTSQIFDLDFSNKILNNIVRDAEAYMIETYEDFEKTVEVEDEEIYKRYEENIVKYAMVFLPEYRHLFDLTAIIETLTNNLGINEMYYNMHDYMIEVYSQMDFFHEIDSITYNGEKFYILYAYVAED